MVARMTAYRAAVRATRLLANAAWFGGSLMEVVALNPAAQEGGTVGEQQRGPAGLCDRASNRPGL